MGKVTKKQLAEKVGLLSVRVSLYRLVILTLAVIVAGLFTVPVLADYIQTGGQAPKIGNVEVYNEAPAAPAQPVELLEDLPKGDIEAGAKIYYVPQNFLQGFEIKGSEYLDEDGLKARATVEKTLDLSATTTDAYQLLFYWINDLPNNEDVWVRGLDIDLITKLNSYGGLLNCGTTTAPTTTSQAETVGFAATSSGTIIQNWHIAPSYDSGTQAGGLISLENATTTVVWGTFFTVGSDGGFIRSSTTPDFLIKEDEALTCTLTPDASASSTDFTTTGNFTGAGKAHLDIYHRNE